VFPRLVRYHIIHHLKQPDRCFGISIIWWDKLFGTAPSNDIKISGRILDFYYAK
jgi:sterol desaturase/sphingolipid hydroxylase (fatty acid hydroxylase superfamily)